MLRHDTLTPYRIFFLFLFTFCGISLLLTAFLEGFGLIRVAGLISADADAVLATMWLTGGLSLLYGTVLMVILMDRRGPIADRRQKRVAIDFPERRSGMERRGDPAAAGEKGGLPSSAAT